MLSGSNLERDLWDHHVAVRGHQGHSFKLNDVTQDNLTVSCIRGVQDLWGLVCWCIIYVLVLKHHTLVFAGLKIIQDLLELIDECSVSSKILHILI